MDGGIRRLGRVLRGGMLVAVLWVGWGLGKAYYVEQQAWAVYRDKWDMDKREQALCRGDSLPDIRVDYRSFVLNPLRSWVADYYKGGQKTFGVNFNPIFKPAACDPFPQSLYQAIARNCDVETVVGFIERGADVNAEQVIDAKSGLSTTPLYTAVDFGRTDVVRALLRHGAEIDVKALRNGALLSPIQTACWRGMRGLFMALLEAGADLQGRDYQGATLLHGAAGRGWTNVFPALLAAGAEIDATNNTGATPLHYAVREGQLEAVQHLLAAGASPNATAAIWDFSDFSVLHMAVLAALEAVGYHQHSPCPLPRLEVVETLLRAGADAQAKAFGAPMRLASNPSPHYVSEPAQHYTPLQMAAFLRPDDLSEEEYRDIVRLFEDAGAPVH